MADETVNVNEMLAEVRAEMHGEPKPEVKQEVKQEPVVDEAEEEQVEEVEEQEDTLEAAEDEEEVAPEPKKKKSWLDRERAKKEEYKAQLEQERADKAALLKEVAELRGLVKQNLAPEKKDEKKAVEPLDPEAHNALLETMDENDRKALVRDFKREAKIEQAIWSTKDPEHERKSELVVAHEAYNLATNAAAMGERMTEQEAIELAKQNLSVALFKVYEKGGSMGEYIQTRAAAIASSLPKKQEEKAAKPKTNLKELDALRKSAGAPTNKRAGGDSDALDMSALLNEARDEVLKETRLGF